ncbi:MAG: LysR substrate-binding domain-containing protein [Hyphomicrobiales bacterium]
MLDRITGLQVFSRVAALGSLSAAARALGMSQTMATKHIAALEARLGTKLLHRTTRRLNLTEAGRDYLDSVDRILADLAEADGRASVAAAEVGGLLRLNVPVSFGLHEVAPLLPDLIARHPALEVDLGLNDRHVDLIEEGWDLVVRIGSMRDSTMVAKKLAPCSTVVCASPAYIERHGRPRTVADLRHHNCLGYTLSRSGGANRWPFGREGTISVPVKGSIVASNGEALTVAALAGHGIIYHPVFLVYRDLAAGRLVPLDLDHPTTPLAGVFAAYPADRRPPAKVRATIDFLAERFGPVPPWER